MSLIAEFMESIGPLIGLIGTVFWIWMLIDCLNRAKARPHRGWLFLLILFTNWIGALIYFFVFVFPFNKLLQSPPLQPPHDVQQKPFIYYTPHRPTSQPYQDYQQGYQPRSVPTPAPQQINTPDSQEDSLQSYYPISDDYEEPHSSYTELPPQQ